MANIQLIMLAVYTCTAFSIGMYLGATIHKRVDVDWVGMTVEEIESQRKCNLTRECTVAGVNLMRQEIVELNEEIEAMYGEHVLSLEETKALFGAVQKPIPVSRVGWILRRFHRGNA